MLQPMRVGSGRTQPAALSEASLFGDAFGDAFGQQFAIAGGEVGGSDGEFDIAAHDFGGFAITFGTYSWVFIGGRCRRPGRGMPYGSKRVSFVMPDFCSRRAFPEGRCARPWGKIKRQYQ